MSYCCNCARVGVPMVASKLSTTLAPSASKLLVRVAAGTPQSALTISTREPPGVQLGVPVGVGVGDAQGASVKLSCRPWDSPPVLHSNCVEREPVSRCTPTVALEPVLPVRLPYMISKLAVFSCRRTSKSRIGGPLEQQNCSRNSMLKMRLGALPLIEVNTPCPFAVSASYRSSQYGAIRSVIVLLGRQALVNV